MSPRSFLTQAARANGHADANFAFTRHPSRQDECPELGARRHEQQQYQRRRCQQHFELVARRVEGVNRTRLEILTVRDNVRPFLTQSGGERECLLLRR
jgi:hypothetical protein